MATAKAPAVPTIGGAMPEPASVKTAPAAATSAAKLRSAPVLYPSAEEFQNPMRYIESIRPLGDEYGILVIQPPPSFQPGYAVDIKKVKFITRQQNLHMVGAGLSRVPCMSFTTIHNVFYVLSGLCVSRCEGRN